MDLKNVEIQGPGPTQGAPGRNSVQKHGPDVPNGGMATHLVVKMCDFSSLGVRAQPTHPWNSNQDWPGALGPQA